MEHKKAKNWKPKTEEYDDEEEEMPSEWREKERQAELESCR